MFRSIVLGFVVGAMAAGTLHAQTPTAHAQQQPPGQPQQPPSQPPSQPPAQPTQPPPGQPTQQPPGQPPAQQAQATPTARMFASDAGMVLNFIKADKTADFEAVIAKLKEALQKSTKPERKQQAASWKVFKSPDPNPNGTVLYVFIIDPSVKGADYTISTILNEAFPQEVQALYKQYADAYAQGQNYVNLALVSDLGK
jgi:pyruvate/2-oxoglutarate dehydrogenase complex dihydrolipoamide acyltransferase (E2) component